MLNAQFRTILAKKVIYAGLKHFMIRRFSSKSLFSQLVLNIWPWVDKPREFIIWRKVKTQNPQFLSNVACWQKKMHTRESKKSSKYKLKNKKEQKCCLQAKEYANKGAFFLPVPCLLCNHSVDKKQPGCFPLQKPRMKMSDAKRPEKIDENNLMINLVYRSREIQFDGNWE